MIYYIVVEMSSIPYAIVGSGYRDDKLYYLFSCKTCGIRRYMNLEYIVYNHRDHLRNNLHPNCSVYIEDATDKICIEYIDSRVLMDLILRFWKGIDSQRAANI
jgi:hypothetical protein